MPAQPATDAAHGQCQECQAGSLDEDDFVDGPAMSDALKAEFGFGRIPLFKIGERLLCASCRDNIGGWAGATTESIALVVNTADGDLVVAYAGKTISYEVENAGARIEDLLLDDAPKGFSIWEGTYRYDSDGDAKNVGKFRPLTPVEWRRLETTGVPWELAAANVPSRSET